MLPCYNFFKEDEKMNENIIPIVKNIAVKDLMNTVEEIRNVPGMYKGISFAYVKARVYDHPEIQYIAVDPRIGLVTLDEGAVEWPHRAKPFYETDNFTTIICDGMKLDGILKLQEGLETILDDLNKEVEKEVEACREYLNGGL